MATYRYWRWIWRDVRGGTDRAQADDVELRSGGSSVAWPGGTTCVGTVTGSTLYWNTGSGEGPENLVDNSTATKGLIQPFTGVWNGGAGDTAIATIDAGSAITADAFRYRTGNDADGRDIISWTFEGSSDNSNWTTLQTGNNESITTARDTWTQDFSFTGGGGGNSISVPSGSIAATGFAPTVTATAGNYIAVPLASISLAGFSPSVSATASNAIAVPAGSITVNGFEPSAVSGINISAPVGSMSMAGYAPNAVSTANQFIAVPAGAMSASGLTPSVGVSDNLLVQVPAGALSLTGIAPAVNTGGPQTVDVQLGALSITVYAPTVSASGTDGGGGPDPRRKWEYEWELLTARMILAKQEKVAALRIEGVKSDVLDASPEPVPQSISSVQDERDYGQFAKLVAAYSEPPSGLAPKGRQAYIEARSRADRAAYEQLLREIEAQRKREDDEFMFLAIEALKHWH